MKRTILTLAMTTASLTFSAGAYALCVELDNYYPHDPTWMGAALRTLSASTHAALRGVHTAGGLAARFISEQTISVDVVTTSGKTGLLATTEAPTSVTNAVLAEGNTSEAVVKLIGSSGALIDGYVDGVNVFRVDSSGVVTIQGQPIAPKGPPGPDGNDGPNGANGPPGQPGDHAAAEDFPACVAQNCLNVCVHGVIESNQSPCTVVGATGGTCENTQSGGYCCRCARAL